MLGEPQVLMAHCEDSEGCGELRSEPTCVWVEVESDEVAATQPRVAAQSQSQDRLLHRAYGHALGRWQARFRG